LSALAEAVWTPRTRMDYAGFVERLRAHLDRLRALDVTFHPLVVNQ
jgi:N-acetyl-beta-hexosaminidase